MPELKIAINETRIDINVFEDRWQGVDIFEGQIFHAWFGGETYDERDENFGSAEIAWMPTDAPINA